MIHLRDFKIMEIRKVLDGFPLISVGHSQDEETARFEESEDISKGAADGRFDVLENFRGDDKIAGFELLRF